MFHSYGRIFVFNPYDVFIYDTISIGDDVFIGIGANFAATKSYISIGNKVMFVLMLQLVVVTITLVSLDLI